MATPPDAGRLRWYPPFDITAGAWGGLGATGFVPAPGAREGADRRDDCSVDARYERHAALGPKGVPFELVPDEPPADCYGIEHCGHSLHCSLVGLAREEGASEVSDGTGCMVLECRSGGDPCDSDAAQRVERWAVGSEPDVERTAHILHQSSGLGLVN